MPVWINEFHYDNAGADAGEFIEVAGTAGTNLSGYKLVLYNGSGGAAYQTITLSGLIPDQSGGFGALTFAAPGLQNGSPDGIALVGPGDVVIEFLSYEGPMTATAGPAAGMTSTDVGVVEDGFNPVGGSVSRTGFGDEASDFAWTLDANDTPGQVNNGQTFPTVPQTVSVTAASADRPEGDAGTTDFTFTVTRTDAAGSATVDWAVTGLGGAGQAQAADFSGPLSGQVTFAPGVTSQVVTVQVAGDATVEGDEGFAVALSNPTGGYTVSGGPAAGVIRNDDAVAGTPWINEFHYDDDGADAGEFIEVAGPAGLSLSGYSLVLYNGSNGQAYGTIALSGSIPDLQGGFGVIQVPAAGLQNGAPDGIALVGPGGVVEFLSYEGQMTATNGPAAGLTSTDVEVSQPGNADGTSISRTGEGVEADHFTWTLSSDDTAGAVNDGQTFAVPAPRVSVGNAQVVEGDDGTATLTFTVTRTGGPDAFTVDYATDGGTATPGVDYAPVAGQLSFAAGETEKTVQVVVSGDTVVEPSETFFLNLSNPTGGAVLTDGQGQGTIVNDDLTVTRIHDVQGSAFFSPVLAADGINAFNLRSLTQVTVEAVVTAIDNEGGRQGFFLVEEGADWDASNLTSEGIFVMTRSDAGAGVAMDSGAFAGLTVGEVVKVTAFVMEYQAFGNLPRTFLVDPIVVAQSNTSVPLPTLVLEGPFAIPNTILTDETPDFFDAFDDPADTFDPANDALDFFETIEGMRVTLTDAVVATGQVDGPNDAVRVKAYSGTTADADQLNDRGGYTIAGDPALSPPDTADPQDAVIHGGRHVHDGDANPDIVELDFGEAGMGGTAGFHNDLTLGDQLGDVTGVIDFDFANVKLYVTDPLDAARVDALDDTTPVQETTTLAADPRSLRIATFNVENLDPTDDLTRDEHLADGVGKFNDLARVIADNLGAPDIICIEEMQDDNGESPGGVEAIEGWTRLAEAVSTQTGYVYQWVDQAPANGADGGAPNGNIRVGFLYNTGRVQLGDLPADASLEDRRKYVDRIGDGQRDAGDLIGFSDDMIAGEISAADWAGTRKTLMGEFTFNGNSVYVLANHWPSKIGSGGFYQADQDIDAGQPANSDWQQRVNVAADVYAMMDKVLSGDPDARVVAGGDFNEFYYGRPLEVLTGHVGVDGAARDGCSRLVNLTVSELPVAERYTYVFDGRSQAIDHVVADSVLAGVADYDIVHVNTGFNSRSGADDPSLSDHDPAVARFDFRSLAEKLAGTAGADTLEGFGGNDTLAGGAGEDVAVFSGALADYAVTRTETGALVAHLRGGAPDGTDRLEGVERLRFADGEVLLRALLNRPPVGVDDAYAVAEDAGVSLDVLANDTDPDADDSRTLTGVSATASGSSVRIEDGRVVYTADADAFDQLQPGQTATDTFTYTFVDAYGAEGQATVTVTVGEAGDNVVRPGTNKPDTILGTAADETIRAGNGEDVVRAGGGADAVFGENGDDRLFGGDGRDSLSGDRGDDWLSGGEGDDRLTGGAGRDTFVLGEGGRDVVTDFRLGDDAFVLADGAQVVDFDLADVDGDGRLDAVVTFAGDHGSAVILGGSFFRSSDFE